MSIMSGTLALVLLAMTSGASGVGVRTESATIGPNATTTSTVTTTTTVTKTSSHVKQSYLPSIPDRFATPFYYSSLTTLGVNYLVPLERVKPYLKPGVVAAKLDGMALVHYNFQVYTGNFASPDTAKPEEWFPSGAAITQEVEFSILVVPKSATRVPKITFEQYMMGEEESKLMGFLRVHVPCDAPVAIAAGVELYGEPKFQTTFRVNLASRNPGRDPNSLAPEQARSEWPTTMGFRIDDPVNATESICTAIVNVTGLRALPGNPSPITEYGEHDHKLIACRWNILGPIDTYFLSEDETDRVQLTYGNSPHQMKKDMEALLEGARPRAVQFFDSSPAAINGRAYYPEF